MIDWFNKDANVLRIDPVSLSGSANVIAVQEGKPYPFGIPAPAWKLLRVAMGGDVLQEKAVLINAKFWLTDLLRGHNFEENPDPQMTEDRMKVWLGL